MQDTRFNPRARDGREPVDALMSSRVFVSIHAPVMDANLWYFTPVLLVGFQSTRP